MNQLQPPSNTTCFRLRTAPLGFDSAAPWKIGAAREPSGALPVALLPSDDRPARTKPRPATRWVALAMFALLAIYTALMWTA